MTTDNYEFKITEGWAGYNSASDPTILPPNVPVQGSQNVYRTDAETYVVRYGQKRRGPADSTIAGITSSFEWETSLGYTRVLRVVDETSAGNDGKLQVEWNSNWYDLLTGLSLVDFVFTTWWDDSQKKDVLIMVNGDDDMKSWPGGIAMVDSATGTTITKTGTETFAQVGFATSGTKQFIDSTGTVYTYTGGESTTTLTGVTPDPSAVTGSIASAIETHTNTPASGFNADFCRNIGNQIYVGSYTSRLIYISNDSDFTDYSVPTPRAPGDPDILTLDNAGKGIGIRDGKAHISAGLQDWYIVSFENITVGTDLTQQTIVDKQETAILAGALNHNFIDMVGNDIIYLSQDNQMRKFGTYRNLNEPRYPSLSEPLKTELSAQDFTGGSLRSVGDFVYITSPVSGVTYIHETRDFLDANGNVGAERFWHPPQIWYISRIAVVDGVVYGHSSQNPQMYQLFNTAQWHDDSPDDVPVPYNCVFRLPYISNGRRQGQQVFDKVYYEGYILPNSQLNATVRYDYNGATNVQTQVISSVGSPPTLFDETGVYGLGGQLIGDSLLGGGGQEEELNPLPKFRVITDMVQKNCFEYQIELSSSEADSRWEILMLGTNAVLAGQQSVYINKSVPVV